MGTSKRVKLRCNTSTSVTNSVPSVSALLSTALPAKCVIVEGNYSNGSLAGYGFEKSSFGARVWVWVRVWVEDFGASRRHSQKYG